MSTVDNWLEQNEGKLRQYGRSLASRFPNNLHDADDLFQIMSMKIYLQARVSPDFMKQSNGYLMKTAWNEGLYALRQERRYELTVNSMPEISEFEEIPSMENLPAEDEGPEVSFDMTDQSQLIALAIGSLPAKSQQVCNLLYAGNKPVEIARKLNVARCTVTKHQKRIQEAFAQFGLQPAI